MAALERIYHDQSSGCQTSLEESVAPTRYRRGNQRSGCQTESFLLFETIIPGRLTGKKRRGGGAVSIKPVDETQPNWGRWGEGRAEREGKNKTGGRGWDILSLSLGMCGGHLFLCRSSYCANTGCLRRRTHLEKMIRCSICMYVCSNLSCWNKWFKHSSSIKSNLHQDSTSAGWCVWWLNIFLKKRFVCLNTANGAQIVTVRWIIHATKTGILVMQLILTARSLACEIIIQPELLWSCPHAAGFTF